MKRIIAIALVMVFTIGVMSAAAVSGKGKPLSCDSDKGPLQGASNHISNWGKSRPIARQKSLRGDREEILKRNGTKSVVR